MRTPYAVTLELQQPLAAAHESLRGALAVAQMTIASEIDTQATCKARIGMDSHPQRLPGLSPPRLALALLTAEPEVVALLPFGCALGEATPGRTRTVQDPRVMAAASGQPEVRAACELARAAWRRVAANLQDLRAASAA